MVPWELSVQQGVLGSLAASTRRAYERAVAGYREFTLACGTLSPFPLTESSTLRYLSHLHGSGLAPKTLRVQLSGLAFFAKLHGGWDPGNSFIVRRALEGWRRLTPPRPDARRPISIQMLRLF